MVELYAIMDFNGLLKWYQWIIYVILIILFAVIVTFAVIQLIDLVYNFVFIDTPLVFENHELLDLFGYFLLVLIGMELLASIAGYINEKVIHVEIVVIIAIIAIVRGVILLEPGNMDALAMFGIAAIILALCSGYYFLKKGGIRNP
jgi:uncharacterized membrane protein (DUF373 family)